MKKLWCPEAGAFLFFWLLLMLAGRERLFRDPGSLWHIVVGERILRQRELPRTDPFTFTHAGETWLAQWWLAECGLALLAHLGGLDAIALAAVTLMAAFLAWLYHRFLRSGMHPLLALLMIALVFLGTDYHFHPRPHVFTIFFVGWTCAKLCDFEAGRISLGRLFWLVPLFVVWTNIHGGMVGGVACLALAGVGWCVTPFVNGPAPLKGRQYFLYATLVLLCGLAAFVNPYGAALPRVWFALMSSPVLPRLMDEHAPLWVSGKVVWIVLIQAVIYFGALLSVPPSRWRVTWLLPLAWLALAWTRVRYGPLFAVAVAITVADAYPYFRWTGWLAGKGSVIFRPRAVAAGGPGFVALIVPAALVTASFVLQAATVPVPVLGAGWVKLDPSEMPLTLLPELREYERDHPEGTPVFNDMLFGGFLMYYTPGLRIFIDDRCELYGDEGLLEYADAYLDNPAQIDRWRQRYNFDAALVQKRIPGTDRLTPFYRYLRDSDDWTMVRETETVTFFRWKKE